MLGRDLLAVSFLRWMPQPILDVRYEPLGGSQIPDGMVIMLRLTAPKNSLGHPAMEQNGSYRVTFLEAVGDGAFTARRRRGYALRRGLSAASSTRRAAATLGRRRDRGSKD